MADDAQAMQEALDRLKVLNDTLGVFHAVRAVVEDQAALSTYPAAAVRQIRRLYDEFDAKHPNAPKAGQ